MTIPETKFSAEDAARAYGEWGANCGPGALAAIAGLTLDEVRPHLKGFEDKHYTNPTMMYEALTSIGRPWYTAGTDWPSYGLVRVQWEGPWTEPGAHHMARQRHTHWIGAAMGSDPFHHGVFDINAIGNGTGWVSRVGWVAHIVPWIIENCVDPSASGRWHLTHSIEVEKPHV